MHGLLGAGAGAGTGARVACLAAAPAVVAAAALVTGVALGPRGVGGGKALHLGVHWRPQLEGQRPPPPPLLPAGPALGSPTAPSYIAWPIMMAQATEGDRYGKALPIALSPGRGSFQSPVGQIVLRSHLRFAPSFLFRPCVFTSPESSFPASWDGE